MRVLEVIDRLDGSKERIAESDPNFRESIKGAAEQAGIPVANAMAILNVGQELVSAGFVRRIISICSVCKIDGDLIPSPSGSGKLVCDECAHEIAADLKIMKEAEKTGRTMD